MKMWNKWAVGVVMALPLYVNAAVPEVVDGVATIHMDQYSGYIATDETLASLKAGTYRFVVTNKSNKLVGFQVQNFKTQKTLDKFPLEPGETKSTVVEITADGFRYRCPINPTPWYDVEAVN